MEYHLHIVENKQVFVKNLNYKNILVCYKIYTVLSHVIGNVEYILGFCLKTIYVKYRTFRPLENST